MPHKIGIGAIMGITSEDGVATQKRVTLMDRSNMSIVAKTTSNENGGYAFNGLNAETNDYLVFAVDDNDPKKQAIIYDRIQPIPGYQGSTFMGNWHKLAMLNDPISGWMGLMANSYPILVSSASGFGGIYDFSAPSLTPGAPHLSSLNLNAGYASFNCRPVVLENPTKGSLEFVFSKSGSGTFYFNAIMGQSSGANFTNDFISGGNYAGPILAITYNSTNKTITLSHRVVGSLYLGDSWVSLITFDVSGYADVIHVAATIEFGLEAKLYINGSLVSTAAISTATSMAAQVQIIGLLISSSYGAPPSWKRSCTANIAVPMFYYGVLTANEIAARYQALMIGSTPLATGYEKEIVLDSPVCYYRLSDPGETNYLNDWLTISTPARRQLTIVNKAGMTFSENSPVVGSSGIRFNGASGARSNFASSISNYAEYSIEFIASFDLANPATNEYIAGVYNTSESLLFGVYRGTNGKFNFLDSTLRTFETLPATGTKKHYVFTLNKITREAKMYVDGVLVETISTDGVTLSPTANNESSNRNIEFMVGGNANDAFTAVTLGMTGFLSEVAFYGMELPASRIKAHHAAMGTL